MSTYTATETEEILACFRQFIETLDWHPNNREDASE